MYLHQFFTFFPTISVEWLTIVLCPMFCLDYLVHLGKIQGGAPRPCISLLPFCPTFLSFLEFTLKNLFAWAGSSFISWHATKELFFSLLFFSLFVLGHDGVARCQYYSRSTMMFDMKEKKGKFSTIIILSNANTAYGVLSSGIQGSTDFCLESNCLKGYLWIAMLTNLQNLGPFSLFVFQG